jgi:hypothetical protein
LCICLVLFFREGELNGSPSSFSGNKKCIYLLLADTKNFTRHLVVSVFCSIFAPERKYKMEKTNKQIIPIYNFIQVVPAFTKLLGSKKGMVLSYLVGKANTHNKQCIFIKYEQAVEDLQLSQSTLYRYFAEFAKAGYITITPGMGRNNNMYCINIPVITELTKKTHQIEESNDEPKTRQNGNKTHQIENKTRQNEKKTRQIEELTNQNDESKKLNTGVNTQINTKLNTTVKAEPNLDPSSWGMSMKKMRRWVELLVLPEYQEDEYSQKRNVAGYSLVDIIKDNKLTFDEFIIRVYPSLIGRHEGETLKTKITKHL